ncbi:MAG: hypothetical protein B7Z15_13720 [Rhizobiales bacterium 32-66-8]|nr:MAG: hypothetical protein B7Z15_13720 [Rhizobiales bacterium 32-66-8]
MGRRMSFVEESGDAGAAAGGSHAGSLMRSRSNLDCDVCIIGGSLAGLLLALKLALRGRDVVVLEPDALSPRAGQPAAPIGNMLLRPGLGLSADQLCTRADRARARTLYDLSDTAFRSAVRLMDVLHVPQTGSGLLFVPGPRGKVDLLDEAAARDELGLSELTRLGRSAVSERLGTEAYAGALFDPEVMQFAAGKVPGALAKAARAAGVRILDHTTVFSADLDGIRKYLETPAHRVRADHVAFCADTGLEAIAPWLAQAVGREYRVTGALLPTFAGPPASEPVIEGGARGVRFIWSGTQLEFCAPTASHVRGTRAAGGVLRRNARRVYPALRRAKVAQPQGVSVARALHGLPLIGSVRPGVWHAVALGEEPMVCASLAADLISSAVTDRDDRIAAFAAFGLAPWHGAAGRFAHFVQYWAGRWTDAAERREARVEEGDPLPPGHAKSPAQSGR